MATIGIISIPAFGHLNPFLILGKQLIKNGHRVVFFQLKEIEQRILDAGFEYHEIGKSIPKNFIQNTQHELGKLSGFDSMYYWRDRQLTLFKAWFAELPLAIEKESVQMLLTDQSDGVGATIADAKKIPYVTVSMSWDLDWEKTIPPFFLSRDYDLSDSAIRYNELVMDEFVKNYAPLFTFINAKRVEYGLEKYDPYSTMYPVSPYAQIAQVPEFLDYPRKEKPAYFINVGPFIDNQPKEIPFPFEKINGKPLVYISLGTIVNVRPGIFSLIAGSFQDIDAQLVISLGNKGVTIDTEAIPKDTIIVDYAPQREVLSRAKLCVSHGGLNTVMDALANAVPIIMIPITFEQPGAAGRIRYHKVGDYIQFKSLSQIAINTMVKKILYTRAYYKNAQKMKEKFEVLNGKQQATGLIEKTLKEHVW